jgi:uncharacterized membrane protein YphA (DoxX/SURF4 family)
MPRPSLGFDLLRIYLGVALFVRGALFVSNPARAQALIERSGDWFMPMLLAHFIGAAHLVGGLLLAIGLATRLAAAVQVPILLGAVFFVHWRDGLLNQSQSLELAGLVLAMLVCYSLCGAGAVSIDAVLHRRPAAPTDLASHSA